MLVLTLVVHAALASAAPLDDAVSLAAADPQLAAALAPRAGTWRIERDGARTPGDRALHGHAAAHANGPLRIGASSGLSLTLSPRGARRARVEVADGRLVYRDAWRSVDLLVTAPERGIEWFLLLRDDTAPVDFSWDVGLGDALTTLRPDGHGGLAMVDREGTTRLVMAAPYAVDARGARRAATLSVTGRRITLSLDRAGLTFPVLLDALVDLAVWELKATGLSRNYAAMAYDTARSRAVLFGGADLAGNVLRTTLEWNGVGWTPVSSTGPSARLSPAMAYDSVRQRTVLFGGSGGGLRGDTWEWDGTTWVLVAAEGGAGPSVRAGAAMAYDSVRQRTVLFGGSEQNDTWEWDGVSWQLRTTATAPSARSNHVMAYDVARWRVLVRHRHVGMGRHQLDVRRRRPHPHQRDDGVRHDAATRARLMAPAVTTARPARSSTTAQRGSVCRSRTSASACAMKTAARSTSVTSSAAVTRRPIGAHSRRSPTTPRVTTPTRAPAVSGASRARAARRPPP